MSGMRRLFGQMTHVVYDLMDTPDDLRADERFFAAAFRGIRELESHFVGDWSSLQRDPDRCMNHAEMAGYAVYFARNPAMTARSLVRETRFNSGVDFDRLFYDLLTRTTHSIMSESPIDGWENVSVARCCFGLLHLSRYSLGSDGTDFVHPGENYIPAKRLLSFIDMCRHQHRPTTYSNRDDRAVAAWNEVEVRTCLYLTEESLYKNPSTSLVVIMRAVQLELAIVNSCTPYHEWKNILYRQKLSLGDDDLSNGEILRRIQNRNVLFPRHRISFFFTLLKVYLAVRPERVAPAFPSFRETVHGFLPFFSTCSELEEDAMKAALFDFGLFLAYRMGCALYLERPIAHGAPRSLRFHSRGVVSDHQLAVYADLAEGAVALQRIGPRTSDRLYNDPAPLVNACLVLLEDLNLYVVPDTLPPGVAAAAVQRRAHRLIGTDVLVTQMLRRHHYTRYDKLVTYHLRTHLLWTQNCLRYAPAACLSHNKISQYLRYYFRLAILESLYLTEETFLQLLAHMDPFLALLDRHGRGFLEVLRPLTHAVEFLAQVRVAEGPGRPEDDEDENAAVEPRHPRRLTYLSRKTFQRAPLTRSFFLAQIDAVVHEALSGRVAADLQSTAFLPSTAFLEDLRGVVISRTPLSPLLFVHFRRLWPPHFRMPRETPFFNKFHDSPPSLREHVIQILH